MDRITHLTVFSVFLILALLVPSSGSWAGGVDEEFAKSRFGSGPAALGQLDTIRPGDEAEQMDRESAGRKPAGLIVGAAQAARPRGAHLAPSDDTDTPDPTPDTKLTPANSPELGALGMKRKGIQEVALILFGIEPVILNGSGTRIIDSYQRRSRFAVFGLFDAVNYADDTTTKRFWCFNSFE